MERDYAAFTGDIPRNYDEGLGPHIFIDYAQDLARRVAAVEPTSVLELAAGTGIVTRCLREELPAATRITATDLNAAMLDVAREKLAGLDPVELKPADAMKLPFDDGSFDAVVCQFGVMFFPDKDGSYREAYRVLAPGGTYVFSVWGPFEANPFARVAMECVETFLPENPPRFFEVPFGYHDHETIRESLLSAAFSDVRTEDVALTKQFANAESFARGLVCGNPSVGELKAAGIDAETVVPAVADALREAFGEAPHSMPLLATVVTASK